MISITKELIAFIRSNSYWWKRKRIPNKKQQYQFLSFFISLGSTSSSRTSGNSWGPSTKTGVTSRRKKCGSCKNDSKAENERRAQPEAIGDCRQTLVRSDVFLIFPTIFFQKKWISYSMLGILTTKDSYILHSTFDQLWTGASIKGGAGGAIAPPRFWQNRRRRRALVKCETAWVNSWNFNFESFQIMCGN